MERDDTLFVTMGRNDNSGYIVSFNTSALVASLSPVKSKTIENKFDSIFK